MALSLAGDGTLSGVDIAASGLGRVLQVVRATDSTQRITTSTSYIDAGISVTITPTKTTSAIILVAQINAEVQAGTFTRARLTITDSSGNAISGAEQAQFGARANDDETYDLLSLWAYATPATTSAVTYKLMGQVTDSGSTLVLRNNTCTAQMYAIEVAA